MKFSHTLSLNANPDWADHYIDYAGLKKIINEVATTTPTTIDDGKVDGGENVELEDVEDTRRRIFLQKLTKMVTSVRQFYDNKKAELDVIMAQLQPMLEKTSSRQDLSLSAFQSDSNETTPLVQGDISANQKKMKSVHAISQRILEDQRREICDLYTQYHNLKLYAQLNCTAVRKILKKHDKVLHDNLQETHIESLRLLLPFWDDNTPEIDKSMQTLQMYFAHFYCNDNTDEAIRKLHLMIRELITYQRHSVWLDVIQDQRKKESAQIISTTDKQGGQTNKNIFTYIQTSTTIHIGLFILMIFAILLIMPGIFDNDPTKRNSLALFVFVSLLWAAETLPLFVTSMLVPFLAVTLRVIVVDGVRLDARSASKHVFGSMFSHVIMLLIGGFSIAAALSKHNIAKVLASSISKKCGSGIRTVLLVNMFVATGASMWISNVAAPVLCYSLIVPILKAATAETSRAAFGTKQGMSAEHDMALCKALVLGIALASNVGGMASPISSPQNLFAIEYTPIGWLAWFVVSIPLCIVLNLIIWAWLIICFKLPKADSTAVSYALHRDRSVEPFTPEQHFVIAVSVGVVLLWCASVNIEAFTGQMGVLGIVPFTMFFGTGILSKEDLNNFLWSVVILAMGGLVLGEAVKTSGLLDVIAENIALFIEDHSLNLWTILCIFTSLILVCTTFVSHTVGAIVVIPIVQAIGSQMQPHNHAKELVFAAALACSAAMGLPVSGFPNMTAVGVEDHLGNRFLTTKDFIKYAIPASIFSLGTILTLGYWLILAAVQIDKL